jgi:hypothetical protein
MEYRIEWDTDGGYGGECAYRSKTVKLNEFLKHILRTDDNNRYGALSPVVARNRSGWRKFIPPFRYDYVMVLDCDGVDKMIGACHILDAYKIKYALVQSSPGKYWVVTDYVDHLAAVTDKMKQIPGVDELFIQHCGRFGISIRGVPTWGRVPVFADHSDLTNPNSIQFYRDLEAHFNRPEMKIRLKMEAVKHGLTSGKMIEMAADPEFSL